MRETRETTLNLWGLATVPHTFLTYTNHTTRSILEKGPNMTNLNLTLTNLTLELASPVVMAGTI